MQIFCHYPARGHDPPPPDSLHFPYASLHLKCKAKPRMVIDSQGILTPITLFLPIRATLYVHPLFKRAYKIKIRSYRQKKCKKRKDCPLSLNWPAFPALHPPFSQNAFSPIAGLHLRPLHLKCKDCKGKCKGRDYSCSSSCISSCPKTRRGR